MKYAVVIEKTPKGYSAFVPDLPGCVAAASTRARTTALLAKAIAMHVAGMIEDQLPVPRPSTTIGYIAPARTRRRAG